MHQLTGQKQTLYSSAFKVTVHQASPEAEMLKTEGHRECCQATGGACLHGRIQSPGDTSRVIILADFI